MKKRVLLLLCLFTFITFSISAKSKNKDKKTPKKDSSFSIVLDKELVLYDILNIGTDSEIIDTIVTLPPQSKLTFKINSYYSKKSYATYFLVTTEENLTFWAKLWDINFEKEFLEDFIKKYHSKTLSNEEEEFIEHISNQIGNNCWQQKKILQDYITYLIETMYKLNDSKKLSFQTHKWFYNSILKLWYKTESDAKTNPLVYLIKYSDSSFFDNSEQFNNFPSYDIDNNFLSAYEMPSGNEKITPLMQAVISENFGAVNDILMNVRISDESNTINYKNATGKTVYDYLQNCKNPEIVNLIYNPPHISFYTDFIAKLAQEDLNNLPPSLYFSIPVSIYYRSLLLPERIYENNKKDFINELEIQEEVNKYNTNINPNVFPFYAFVDTDDNSNLRMRSSSSTKSSAVGSIPQHTRVKVLEVSQNYDQISNIIDYWYKVSYENTEGWCFGGFLSYRIVTIDESTLKEKKVGPQQDFYCNKPLYAVKNTKIHFLNNSYAEIKPGEELTILGQANDEYKKYSDAIYNYYLVKYQNKYGIINGENFTDTYIGDSDNYKYYLKYSLLHNDTCKAMVYRINKSTNKSEQIEFYEYDDNNQLVKQPMEIDIAQNYYTGRFDNPLNLDDAINITIDSQKHELLTLQLFYNRGRNNAIIAIYTIKDGTNKAIQGIREYTDIYNSSEYNAYAGVLVRYHDAESGNPATIQVIHYGGHPEYDEYGDYDMNGKPQYWTHSYYYKRSAENPYIYKLYKEEQRDDFLEL